MLDAKKFTLANPGLVHTCQLINVEDFDGKGETSPKPYFYQNVGEAEFAVALYQYMVLIGYPPTSISIITTYNGQKSLIEDIMGQRCGRGTPFFGMSPRAISTVDQYQGQQNDVSSVSLVLLRLAHQDFFGTNCTFAPTETDMYKIILLSLVRTETIGHLRDIRRLIVAVSRARLGLYILCRSKLFTSCHELKPSLSQFADKPDKLQIVLGEQYPSERPKGAEVPIEKVFEVEDVSHLGAVVHSMQDDWLKEQENP